MRLSKLMALVFGAMFFMALGTTSLSAMDKCGAGKCGDAKPAPAMKCGAGKCGGDKNVTKCGGDKKAQPAMKCGAGKCG